ncbi:hypothetical protein, partial [Microbulbifer sp. HZ11]|uniref:hypothetical protein n=1 Tax=Microbulbifer sp. HZ11 TaxID=1453501 RepID=UPI001E2BB4FC
MSGVVTGVWKAFKKTSPKFHEKNLNTQQVLAGFRNAKKKKGRTGNCTAFWILSLTMTYSHMGNPHTTIGDV